MYINIDSLLEPEGRLLVIQKQMVLLLKHIVRRFDPQFELMGLGNANTD